MDSWTVCVHSRNRWNGVANHYDVKVPTARIPPGAYKVTLRSHYNNGITTSLYWTIGDITAGRCSIAGSTESAVTPISFYASGGNIEAPPIYIDKVPEWLSVSTMSNGVLAASISEHVFILHFEPIKSETSVIARPLMSKNFTVAVRSASKMSGTDNQYVIAIPDMAYKTPYRCTVSGTVACPATTELQFRCDALTRYVDTGTQTNWAAVSVYGNNIPFPTGSLVYFSEGPRLIEIRHVYCSTGAVHTGMAAHSFIMHFEALE
jgi:hypothetical protein